MAYLLERSALGRAHSTMILLLVGGGLVLCALGAVIFDLGLVIGAW